MAEGIVLAGGRSERLSVLKIPKQFVEVAGVPLIIYCIGAFEKCEDISGYVIVAGKKWRGSIRSWLGTLGAEKFRKFAMPGETRQHSIYNGLLAVQPFRPDRVIIHDAARPLIVHEQLSECIAVSLQDDADGATPALPISDTVYKSTDGSVITDLLNRDELFAGQTPECYDFTKYFAAHEALSSEDIGRIRGSSEIAFKAGMKIRLYGGNALNFKITTAGDLSRFMHIVEDTYKKV